MNYLKYFSFALVLGFLVGACTSYEPQVYGPQEYELTLEGPFFEGGVADGIATLKFDPEKFGLKRDQIHSMKLNEITVSCDHPDGMGIFENIVFSVMTDNTDTKELASKKIKGNAKEITIKGLDKAEIEGFANTKDFYLEMTGITRKDVEENIVIKGKLSLNIMIPEGK